MGFSGCGSSGSPVPEITNQDDGGDADPFPVVMFVSLEAGEQGMSACAPTAAGLRQ